MVLSKMKLDFKKWETILSENAISLSGNKDHPNACLVYMLYCLANEKRFNLDYYMAKRMASMIKSDSMVSIWNASHSPLKASHQFMVDGKRPHPQTSLGSSSSPSQTPTQGKIDPVDNFTPDPVVYIDQLPPILRGASEEFSKQKNVQVLRSFPIQLWEEEKAVPTIEENGVTRPRKYSELTHADAIQADCDVKATNIILQGLPPEERECKLYDEFDKFAYKKGETLRDFYLRFSLLLNDMNIYNVKLEQF
ncbi:hypothetical protein Tco_0323942 [Tanacetum coccineum]